MKINGKRKPFIYPTGKPLSYGNDQNLIFYHLSRFGAALIKVTPSDTYSEAGWMSSVLLMTVRWAGRGCGSIRRDVQTDGSADFINLDLHYGFSSPRLSEGRVSLMGIISQPRGDVFNPLEPAAERVCHLCPGAGAGDTGTCAPALPRLIH